MSSPYWPFVTLAVSVAFIIFGIGKLRLHAFIALLTAALIAGLMTGKEAWEVVQWDPLESTCRHASLSIL